MSARRANAQERTLGSCRSSVSVVDLGGHIGRNYTTAREDGQDRVQSPTVILSLIFSNFAGPIPATFMMSSIWVNGPFAWR